MSPKLEIKSANAFLMYDHNDLQTAVDAIERITRDEKLRDILYVHGQETALARDWMACKDIILNTYKKVRE